MSAGSGILLANAPDATIRLLQNMKLSLLALPALVASLGAGALRAPLSKIRIAGDGRSFETADRKSFVPFGVNYYRPGTG